MTNDQDMKKMLALFESEPMSGTEAPEDFVRIAVTEKSTSYYKFRGTEAEARAFIQQINEGYLDIEDDDRASFDSAGDFAERSDARIV